MGIADRMIDFVHHWAVGPAIRRWPVSIVGMFAFLTAAVGVVWGAVLMDDLLGLRVSAFLVPRQILGFPLVVLGAVLMDWTLIFFFRERGTPFPLNPPRRLITTGPYGVTRNPMLTGWFLAFFGLAILLGSVLLFFVVTPFLMVAFTVFVIGIEEPELTKRFGEDYARYCKQVPRFFPKFRGRSNRRR